jgi:hypothetical protein
MSAADSPVIKMNLVFMYIPPNGLALFRTKQISYVEPEVERNAVGIERDTAREAQFSPHYFVWFKRHPRTHAVFPGKACSARGKAIFKHSVTLA